MPLEVLNFTFVLFRRHSRLERAEVLPSALRILLARIETVLAGLEFADHSYAAFCAGEAGFCRLSCAMREAEDAFAEQNGLRGDKKKRQQSCSRGA
jgi:hypothetical protein